MRTFDELKNTVRDFQSKRLQDDQAQLLDLELAGRKVLYSQLAEAYRIGLMLLEPANGTMFCRILEANDLSKEAEKHEKKPDSRSWRFVTKLLYGKFVENEWQGNVFYTFEANRSAEKYATAFRYMAEILIQPDSAAQWLTDFQHEKGNGLSGAVEVGRAHFSNPAKKSVPEEIHIRNGRMTTEQDVFEIPLPENQFDGQFGQVFFEIIDGKAVAYGFTKLEQNQFEALAAKRGRAMIQRAKEQQAAADKLAKDAADELRIAQAILKNEKVKATAAKVEKVKTRLLEDPDWADALVVEKENFQNIAENDAKRVAFLETHFHKGSSTVDLEPKIKLALKKHKLLEATQTA
jgi:hypothetical protein